MRIPRKLMLVVAISFLCVTAFAALAQQSPAPAPADEKTVTAAALPVDPAPTPAAAREWASMIPNARSLELPTAHLSNIGAAGEFNQQVLNFLLGD